MTYKKFFGASVLAMGMTLGFTSCGSDDFVEQAQPTVETQNAYTVDQKKELIQNTIKGFSAKFGKNSSPVMKKITTLPELPEGETPDVVAKLKEILENLFGGTTDPKTIEAYIQLSQIHGEFTFDGTNWTIVSLTSDDLVLNYVKDGKTYSTKISFGETQKVYCSDLVKEISVFGKTIVIKAAVGVPVTMNVTTTEDGVKVLDGTLGVTISDPSDFNITTDAWTLTSDFAVKYDKVDGTVKSVAEFEGGLQSMEATISDETLGAATLNYVAEGKGGTLTGTVEGVEFEGKKITASIEAKVNDTKELFDNIVLLYKPECSEEDAIRCIDIINANLNGGIKVYMDGSKEPVATMTFTYVAKENGGYALQPVVDGNKEAVIEIISNEIADALGLDADTVNKVIAVIEEALESGEQLTQEQVIELIKTIMGIINGEGE